MNAYHLRQLPEGLIARATQRAREEGTSLEAVLLRFLESYAEHGTIQRKGGAARAQAMTPAARAASAKHASAARWGMKR